MRGRGAKGNPPRRGGGGARPNPRKANETALIPKKKNTSTLRRDFRGRKKGFRKPEGTLRHEPIEDGRFDRRGK